VGAFLDSAEYECSWGGVASCRNMSEAGHVLAGWYSEFVAHRGSLRIRRTQISYRCLQILLESCVDSEENQGKRLCPMLIRVAHDGCLQCPAKAFHEPVSREVVGCRSL
jgi:hypothetical protein